MITAMIVSPEQKNGGVLKAAMYQGQWGYYNGSDASGEDYISPVTTTQATGLQSDLMFPIQFWFQNSEQEETYQNATAVPSGNRVVAYVGNGIMIEDDYLYTRVGSGTYVSGTAGDWMYLNASGYPVVAFDQTVTGTAVAIFKGLVGTTVRYQTISDASMSGLA